MKQLTDLDKMPSLSKYKPSGEHQGKPMQDVPASYLHFLWTEFGKEHDKQCPVADYIRRNIGALAKEHPDGIW